MATITLNILNLDTLKKFLVRGNTEIIELSKIYLISQLCMYVVKKEFDETKLLYKSHSSYI